MASYQTEEELSTGTIKWNMLPQNNQLSTTRQSRVNCMRDPSKCPGYKSNMKRVGFYPLTVRKGGRRKSKSKSKSNRRSKRTRRR